MPNTLANVISKDTYFYELHHVTSLGEYSFCYKTLNLEKV